MPREEEKKTHIEGWGKPGENTSQDMQKTIMEIQNFLEVPKHSSEVKMNPSQDVEKTRYERGPDGNWVVVGREIVPKETTQQKHKAYPGHKEGKQGRDKRVKADPLTHIDRQVNK